MEPWSRLPSVGPFLRHDGEPARQQTLAKMCWDARCLYVLFVCEDDDIWGTCRNHDDPLYDEEVCEIFIDPTGRGERYFEIEVNPLNVTFDCVNTWPEGKLAWDVSWECEGLRTAAKITTDADGRHASWSVEIAIPWTSLELTQSPKPGDEFRINLYRIDRDRSRGHGDEYQCWSPVLTAAPDFNVPSRFGKVHFM